MMMATPSILVILLAFGQTIAHYTFTSPCTKTCGGGHHYIKKCSENDPSKCEKTYMECNTLACQSLPSCLTTYKFNYGSESSCCAMSEGTCGSSLVHRSPQKIFEAQTTVVGEWPWAAAIVSRRKNTRSCSGVLVHKDWVLTAGHCAQLFGTENYYVLLGGTSIEQSQATKQKIDIKRFVIHEEYDFPVNDIALIELKKSAILGDSVKQTCLPNGEEVQTDATCVSLGWGNAKLSALPSGGILRHVSFRHLPEDACLNGLKHLSSDITKYKSKENLCFAVLSGKNYQCSGDTGGPIMCQRKSSCEWFVAGMASYGPNPCGKAGLPEVYMKVKHYEEWIKNRINILSSPSKESGDFNTSPSSCTKTCGGGHHYIEKCINNDVSKCEKTYMECNTHACPSLDTCPINYEFSYGSKSSCCARSKGTCGVSSVQRNPERIFDAKKTMIGEWPWATAVVSRRENTRSCSGILIHKDWVLTTGHCAQNLGKENYYLLLGGTSIEQSQAKNQRIDIKSVAIHEEYEFPVNDIALIELKKSALLSDSVKPICLPNGEEVRADAICVSVGWGNANLNAPFSGGILRHVSFRHLPTDACLSGLKHATSHIRRYNSQENLCFAVLSGKDYQCSGDTGGPIMCQRRSSCEWFVAGMASYGPNPCGKMGLPEVYMKVKGYEAWIREKIHGLQYSTE